MKYVLVVLMLTSGSNGINSHYQGEFKSEIDCLERAKVVITVLEKQKINPKNVKIFCTSKLEI